MNAGNQIRYWAHMLDESFNDSQRTVRSLDDAYSIINKYVKDTGNKLDLDICVDAMKDDNVKRLMSDGKWRDDIETALSVVKEALNLSISGNVNKHPDEYGIELHDDSDYDWEYGYGEYKYYDEEQIDETVNEEVDSAMSNIENELIEVVNDFLDSGEKDFKAFVQDNRNGIVAGDADYDAYVVL